MIGPMLNPDDDDIKSSLLEQLMGEMDDRVSSQLPNKDGAAGVTVDITVSPKGGATMGDDDSAADDLGDVPPDMAELIRQKRGGY